MLTTKNDDKKESFLSDYWIVKNGEKLTKQVHEFREMVVKQVRESEEERNQIADQLSALFNTLREDGVFFPDLELSGNIRAKAVEYGSRSLDLALPCADMNFAIVFQRTHQGNNTEELQADAYLLPEDYCAPLLMHIKSLLLDDRKSLLNIIPKSIEVGREKFSDTLELRFLARGGKKVTLNVLSKAHLGFERRNYFKALANSNFQALVLLLKQVYICQLGC